MATQAQVSNMVQMHVKQNLNDLIMYLAKNDDHDFTDEVIRVFSQPDYDNAIFESDVDLKSDDFGSWWVLVPGNTPDGPYDSKYEARMAACHNNGIEPYLTEAYEWYSVSDWIARKLEERGEMVQEIFGMNVWGRTCSGQAILLDNVMEDIYNSVHT